MAKSNIRSFRYSDKVADILDKFEGKTLNDKFENLVLYCFDSVETRNQQLDEVNKSIQIKRNEYYKLCEKLRSVSTLIDTLKTLERYGDMAAKQAESMSKEFNV